MTRTARILIDWRPGERTLEVFSRSPSQSKIIPFFAYEKDEANKILKLIMLVNFVFYVTIMYLWNINYLGWDQKYRSINSKASHLEKSVLKISKYFVGIIHLSFFPQNPVATDDQYYAGTRKIYDVLSSQHLPVDVVKTSTQFALPIVHQVKHVGYKNVKLCFTLLILLIFC